MPSLIHTVPRAATFRSVVRRRDNAFGLVRLVLASAVIVDHAFPLSGRGESVVGLLTRGQVSLGGLAVEGFFVVSGLLVTRSAMAADPLQFLWRRALRILPAFWLVLVMSALVVAPAFFLRAHGSLAGYWTADPARSGPLTYLTRNVTLHMGQYGILDAFADTPYGHVFGGSVLNGSLWTLEDEFRCYLLVGALALFAVLTRARALVPLAAGALLLLGSLAAASPEVATRMAPWLVDGQLVHLAAAFLLGSSVAVHADRVPLDGRLALGALLVAVVTLVGTGGYHLVGLPALAYALLWAAYRAPARLQRVAAVDDYSYGLYLWGFLVQMALAELGVHRLGLLPYVVLAWALSLACAVLSWHLVEKRALRLRSWGPGRGLAHWRGRWAPSDRRRLRREAAATLVHDAPPPPAVVAAPTPARVDGQPVRPH